MPKWVCGSLIINKLLTFLRYDHTDEITALDFHPREQILVSASRDCCIKLFDITKASAKKAYKSITVCIAVGFIFLQIY